MGTGVEAGPCPECGIENAADHNYCKNCGTPLGRDDGSSLKLSFAERMRDRCLELLRTQPDNARAHFDLGLSYYHLGQTGNATRAFERCLQIEDAYPAAHFQLALCHYRRGAMAECAAASRRALELNPSSAPAHFRLAIALFHQGRLDEAAGAFERTVQVDPEYVIASYHLGLIRERQKRIDDAIGCFEKVVEANPDDASAHYHLGLATSIRGWRARDELALEALELDPSDTAARRAAGAAALEPSLRPGSRSPWRAAAIAAVKSPLRIPTATSPTRPTSRLLREGDRGSPAPGQGRSPTTSARLERPVLDARRAKAAVTKRGEQQHAPGRCPEGDRESSDEAGEQDEPGARPRW